MSPSEKFLRFAVECEAMAKFACDRESKAVWQGFAARWIQYAESIERRSATAHLDTMTKQQAHTHRMTKRPHKPKYPHQATGNRQRVVPPAP